MSLINAHFPSSKVVPPLLDDFKSAFRQLAGGVSVIAVDDGDQKTGFTATSVSSLSADPPSLVVCVNTSSSTFRILRNELAFSVNVLSATQKHVADNFAGRNGVQGANRFLGAIWNEGLHGAPVLANALAAIECRVEEIVVRNSHAIIIGGVLAAHVNADAPALIYWRGDYAAHHGSALSVRRNAQGA